MVIGHQADRVEPLLVEVARRRRVAIRIVRADGWAAGNGASLLAARACLDEPFILMMGDHIVSETILERLIGRGLAGDACVLAVDHGRSPWVDPADVTRVCTAGDRIVAIGKGLSDSEIYDTGVFLCSPEVFDAAERALRGGNGSVSTRFGSSPDAAPRRRSTSAASSGSMSIRRATPSTHGGCWPRSWANRATGGSRVCSTGPSRDAR